MRERSTLDWSQSKIFLVQSIFPVSVLASHFHHIIPTCTILDVHARSLYYLPAHRNFIMASVPAEQIPGNISNHKTPHIFTVHFKLDQATNVNK